MTIESLLTFDGMAFHLHMRGEQLVLCSSVMLRQAKGDENVAEKLAIDRINAIAADSRVQAVSVTPGGIIEVIPSGTWHYMLTELLCSEDAVRELFEGVSPCLNLSGGDGMGLPFMIRYTRDKLQTMRGQEPSEAVAAAMARIVSMKVPAEGDRATQRCRIYGESLTQAIYREYLHGAQLSLPQIHALNNILQILEEVFP